MKIQSSPSALLRGAILGAFAIVFFTTLGVAQVIPPNNETDTKLEVDACFLFLPGFVDTVCGANITVSGLIFEDSVTFWPGESTNPVIIAHVGYGPFETNPWTAGWVWFPAPFKSQFNAGTDEYEGVVTLPDVAGDYSLCIRFSLDGGASATYADGSGAGTFPDLTFEPAELWLAIVASGGTCGTGSCCDMAGDADNNQSISIGDVVKLIDYIFLSGPEPDCPQEADADISGGLNIGDVVYLIAYIFAGGPEAECGPF